MPFTSWRVTGLETFDGQDLELSELHLYDANGRVCAGAQLSSSHSPVNGALVGLGDNDLQTVCRFAGADAMSPGFWLRWDLLAPKDVTRVRLAAGPTLERAGARLRIQVLVGSTWIEVSNASQDGSGYDFVCSAPNAWYDEEMPAVRVSGITGEVSTESGAEVSISIPPGTSVGDFLLIFVMHRSALTLPQGWSLVSTSPAISNTSGTSQWQSVIAKVKTVEDAMSPAVLVKQTAVGRLVTGLMAFNMQGMLPQVQVLTDKVSGPGNVQAVLPILVRPQGLGISSSALIAVSGGVWVPPANQTLVLGSVGNVGARRLGVAYTDVQGILGGSFVVPTDSEVVEKTRISLSVYPGDEQRVLKKVARKYSAATAGSIRVTGLAVPESVGMSEASPLKAMDVEFGGRGLLFGVVKDHETKRALQRRVRLFRSRDGYLVRETWSAEDGTYRFDGINERYEYDIEAWDHEKNFFSVVANNQMPEVA